MVKYTHNSSAIADKFSVFDHFVGLTIKGLNLIGPFSPFRVMFLFYVPPQKLFVVFSGIKWEHGPENGFKSG